MAKLDDKKPLISIIIPTYNTDLYVSRCIYSALGQSYKNIEVIVVDDGSTDGTVDLIKGIQTPEPGYPILRRFYFEENRGAAAARNKGIREAMGSYIFFLDSDDYLAYDAIEELFKVMTEYDSDILRIEFTRDNAGIVTMDRNAYMRLLLDDHLKSYVIATCFNKRLFDNLQFQEGNLLEDYELYPKIVEKMHKISMIRRKDLYVYTEGRHGSTTQTTAKAVKGLLPRMVHAEERYVRYKNEFYEPCRNVLAQFANYACMVYLLDKGEMEKATSPKRQAWDLICRHYEEMMKCDAIPKFRKLELWAIHNESPLTCIFTALHKLKQKL